MEMTIDLNAYLERIEYLGDLVPNLETLQKLQECHTRTIPYEDLNPLLGIPVKLDPESLQRKIVQEKRGGYCFEQNGLFRLALEAIGFQVIPLAGRVLWNHQEDEMTARTHMILLVNIEQQPYISDVGFGGQVPTIPLLLNPDKIQETPLEPYKFEKRGDDFLLKSPIRHEWRTLYRFNLNPVPPIDYKLANWYTSTHPDSPFVHDLKVVRTDTGCRYTLLNNRLTIHRINRESEHQFLAKTGEIREALESVFKLHLPRVNNLEPTLAKILEREKQKLGNLIETVQ